jgi:hypothetical protein
VFLGFLAGITLTPFSSVAPGFALDGVASLLGTFLTLTAGIGFFKAVTGRFTGTCFLSLGDIALKLALEPDELDGGVGLAVEGLPVAVLADFSLVRGTLRETLDSSSSEARSSVGSAEKAFSYFCYPGRRITISSSVEAILEIIF